MVKFAYHFSKVIDSVKVTYYIYQKKNLKLEISMGLKFIIINLFVTRAL